MKAVSLSGALSVVMLGACAATGVSDPYSRDTYAVSGYAQTPVWQTTPVQSVPAYAQGQIHHVSASKGSSPLWDQDAAMTRRIDRQGAKICGPLGYREIRRQPTHIIRIGGGTQFDYDVTIQCLK